MKNWYSVRILAGFVVLLTSASLSGCGGSSEPGKVAEKDEIAAFLEENPELVEEANQDLEGEDFSNDQEGL